MSMGKPDLLMKAFFSNPYVFADVFNFWLHDGAQLIKPENLREASGNLINLKENNIDQLIDQIIASADDEEVELPNIEVSERIRDVLMHLVCMEDNESVYAILGIEGQTHVDYALAARTLLYDALQINKQVEAIQDQHRTKGELGSSNGEFLWRFFKTDRLVPVITVVVYLGSSEWDGPRTLHDMFETKNQALLRESTDYRLKLIEPRRMHKEEIEKFQTSMREVLLYMKASGNKQELLKLAQEGKLRKVDRVTAHLINAVSHSKLKIEKGRENIDMCKAIEGIREDARIEGVAQGIEQGIMQGIEINQKEVSLRMAAEGMAVSLIARLVNAREETVERWLLTAVQS